MNTINGIKTTIKFTVHHLDMVETIKLEGLTPEFSPEQLQTVQNLVDRTKAHISRVKRTPNDWAAEIEKVNGFQNQCWVACMIWWRFSNSTNEREWMPFQKRWVDEYDFNVARKDAQLSRDLQSVGYYEDEADSLIKQHTPNHLARMAQEHFGSVKMKTKPILKVAAAQALEGV